MSVIRQYDYSQKEAVSSSASLKGKEVLLIACHFFLPLIERNAGPTVIYVHKGSGVISGIFSFLIRTPSQDLLIIKEDLYLAISEDNKFIVLNPYDKIEIPENSTVEMLLTVKA